MAARAWIGRLQGAILSRPQRVALSGGTSARLLFDAVVQLAAGQPGLFDSVEFFWADERCVPPSDSESNYRLAWDRLLSPLGIQRQRIHRILGECAPEEAAVLASEELGDRVLDLAFLGMGEDGHVASLFPNASQASIEAISRGDGRPETPAPAGVVELRGAGFGGGRLGSGARVGKGGRPSAIFAARRRDAFGALDPPPPWRRYLFRRRIGPGVERQ
jgi:6-phosphogluconolactonase/glucosamine-6-phosphate isomerase/deaminase